MKIIQRQSTISILMPSHPEWWLPWKKYPYPNSFIAEWDVILYGILLWSVQVHCPDVFPSSLLFTPRLPAGPGGGGGKQSEKQKKPHYCASSAQQQLKHSCVINAVLTPDANLALYRLLWRNVILSQSVH